MARQNYVWIVIVNLVSNTFWLWCYLGALWNWVPRLICSWFVRGDQSVNVHWLSTLYVLSQQAYWNVSKFCPGAFVKGLWCPLRLLEGGYNIFENWVIAEYTSLKVANESSQFDSDFIWYIIYNIRQWACFYGRLKEKLSLFMHSIKPTLTLIMYNRSLQMCKIKSATKSLKKFWLDIFIIL